MSPTDEQLCPGEGGESNVHLLFVRIRLDTVEHDVGQHVGEQEREAAGQTLNAGEGALRWLTVN